MNPLVTYGRCLGATVEGSGTRFVAYSTTARECSVRLYDANGHATQTYELTPMGDGMFEQTVSGVGDGALYKFVVDGNELPDPYARFLPLGVHGPARVVESKYSFRHAPVARPLSEQVIYELHVGTFTRQGTYRAAMAELPRLAKLGVTTLELMPVASFAGTRGWGYDGVAMFAPFAPYGSPDELRAFVDEAHGHGLSVLLDVVYNHFGPAGNYLSAYSPEYFTNEVENAWGPAPDYAHRAMRSFVLANVDYWLRDFCFDGLRLDAVHAIVDSSEKHVLAELVDHVRTMSPDRILIAEDDRNDPRLIRETGLDAVWADDFHHEVRVTLTREKDGYYGCYEPSAAAIARTIRQGFFYEGQVYPTTGKARGHQGRDLPSSAFVYCIQNHDQIGNRALGDRITEAVSLDAYCMISSLLLFLPTTPLLFMGQEWAARTPFCYFTDHDPELGQKVSEGRRAEFAHFRAFSDPEQRSRIPDPQDPATFSRSVLDPREREQPPHARVYKLHQRLLELRRNDPVLRSGHRENMTAEAHDDVLIVRRWHEGDMRVLLANFGKAPRPLADFGLPRDAAVVLDSMVEGPSGTLSAERALILSVREGAP